MELIERYKAVHTLTAAEHGEVIALEKQFLVRLPEGLAVAFFNMGYEACLRDKLVSMFDQDRKRTDQ